MSSENEGSWGSAILSGIAIVVLLALVEIRYEPKTTAERVVGMVIILGDLATERDMHPREFIDKTAESFGGK